MRKIASIALLLTICVGFIACNNKPIEEVSPIQRLLDQYAEFELTTDISKLTKNEKQMLPILMEVADIMDELFWKDAIGDKTLFLEKLSDSATIAYSKINYGPWDRLNNNQAFVDGFGTKPKGANFYPVDMTPKEFNAIKNKMKSDWYTKIQRNKNGQLKVVPYHVAYKEQIVKVAELLQKASALAEDTGLKKYLELRSTAFLTDDYLASDLVWMDMKTNTLDFVVGPIENYEDALYGYKASHSSLILVKDKVWSKKLSKFTSLLPRLQKSLPVPAKYKAEKANANADINVYDVIYYAGDCNAGSKNIAINLPNDPRIHKQKGSRKLQFKNTMKAKFNKILVPISELLIDKNQRQNITFDAFFENVMFHEVAHGLGIQFTLKDHQTVRKVLKDTYTSIEEGKADILSLYMITQMTEWGEMDANKLFDNYVTFMASIFRSVRFGASSAHGKANMIRFYFFEEQGAFTRNAETGTYKVNFDKMKIAINELGKQILIVQGDGNYEAAKQMIAERGFIRENLQKDLDRMNNAGIPKDVVFKQGAKVLGLQAN